MNKTTKGLGAAVLALSLAAGATACRSTSAQLSSGASEAAAAAPVAVVEHKPAEVKKFLDGFFADVDKETAAYMEDAMSGGLKNMTDDEKTEVFKKSYPKSRAYLDTDDKTGAGIIGNFALTTMFTKGETTANVDGIRISGDTATIKGSEIRGEGLKESSGDGKKAGTLKLAYEGSGWKITGMDVVK
ncbi:hypothetical protein HER39_18620 [Arthrobacter deserti]|uniref:DUF4440 domain-containing protein n=1 Tax=Arthrobacter deserti TaxID=1742687 RepID=A0ABX1JUB0_9MICC|nr:hypothetical protein [Arthrobacter deserti]